MNLRGENSAILGANVYDATNNSNDCYAYLSASFNNKTPIVLQASLNAVGQKFTKNINHGYLKPKVLTTLLIAQQMLQSDIF